MKQNGRQPAADRKGTFAKRLKNKGLAKKCTVLNERIKKIGKTNGFFTFLLFLHFGTRILTKNATWFYKNVLLELIYKVFARQNA